MNCDLRQMYGQYNETLSYESYEIDVTMTTCACCLYFRQMPLTHIPLVKMAAVSQTVFSDSFSWMRSFVFWLKVH